MADGVFTTGYQMRSPTNIGASQRTEINYTDDNLFAGVWRLNNDNLNRFDTFLTGYAFIIWTLGCRFMRASGGNAGDGSQSWADFKALTERNFKAFSGIQDFTLDTDNVSMGFTGNDFPVATNLKKDITNFSLRHYEMMGSPVRRHYQYWITGIRDPETGLATYHGLINSAQGWEYSIKNHSAEIIYIVTDPSGARSQKVSMDTFNAPGDLEGTRMGIEFACLFTNGFPTKVPQEHLNYTSGEHSIPEIDIDFRGNYHQSFDINDLAGTIMQYYSYKRTFGNYQVDRVGIDENISNGYNEQIEAVD